jgi:hypothetical protein
VQGLHPVTSDVRWCVHLHESERVRLGTTFGHAWPDTSDLVFPSLEPYWSLPDAWWRGVRWREWHVRSLVVGAWSCVDLTWLGSIRSWLTTSGLDLSCGAMQVDRWDLTAHIQSGDTWTPILDRMQGAARPVIPTGACSRHKTSADREPTTLFWGDAYLRCLAGTCSLSCPFALT